MTVEMNRLVTLDEIEALNFKCSECGVSVSIPSDKWARFPDTCPGCQRVWFKGMSESLKAMGNFQAAIQHLSKQITERPKLKPAGDDYIFCDIRLQMREPKERQP